MRFEPTALEGVWIIHAVRNTDERGFFARTWCAQEFADNGMNPRLSQCNISFNASKGTVGGMHFQEAPHGEAKVVRCTAGAIHDVVVDLRPQSATYLKDLSVQLTADSHTSLYIPEGFAHGFQTLHDNSEVFYQMSVPFHAESARGIRWNDPALKIVWPLPISQISSKDEAFPDLVVAGVAS